ncbi:hypothetical protein A8F94_06525 [Bacillus sp. FJAT-27225]|uniref:DUF192 domain-containing protein n=1 Tax=Bacillus sp. FJAT-27225 TaxID=1743144 RepID=UPI00080C2CD5|nr:DUF192 domain-containing protein [Bacillus sp. FJAT-27225]OCA87519.1 hypothetical protein A8F94_06525 [Bacillus sp. FJAT-27225]
MQEKTVLMPFPIKKADTFFTRLKGLMFKKEAIQDEGLWILPCNSVHMFFMSFSIDVLLLNEHMEVVQLYPSLEPWRVTKPNKHAYSTLELPEGIINKLEISVGDVIKIS